MKATPVRLQTMMTLPPAMEEEKTPQLEPDQKNGNPRQEAGSIYSMYTAEDAQLAS
jgi:hypothetical protein